MPTAPPAGWYVDPDGSPGQRYWDGQRWTSHRRAGPPTSRAGVVARLRERWAKWPVPMRVLLTTVLVLALIGIGWKLATESPGDDWDSLPNRLNCQIEDGPKPPENLTISSVEVKHPRSNVLQLTVRFAKALPSSPTGTPKTKFVGYVLTYDVANDGTKFAELGPAQDTDDLAITDAQSADPGESGMRPDRDTNARRIAPDTISILLDLTRFGVDDQRVRPDLTLNAQFDTPSTTTVRFARQVCR
ncbi:hypothetical protein A5634_20520 [Mycobacterium asiaticum]|uniref:DUF2510 domain-containing protein n=1 Tax=Mycobacterium asiaticum TaxID=1790 RepID=A0A1A3P7A6_MYCAS|nr:hypothetical protein A5634_20520 [Mycobacterium asiaticum]